ncbi:hypothetical protein THIX_20069 [Thiomonas sp. X19]|nr:hypothetical protein THIX_20069 [Thiomonas sp. X19]
MPMQNPDEKKPRPKSRFFSQRLGRESDRTHVGSLQAFLALLDFEFDALVFGQGLEAAALNFAEMDEQVSVAAILGNKAEALAFVEPFHNARLGRHDHSLLFQMLRSTCRRSAETRKNITWGIQPGLPRGAAVNSKNLQNDNLVHTYDSKYTGCEPIALDALQRTQTCRFASDPPRGGKNFGRPRVFS